MTIFESQNFVVEYQMLLDLHVLFRITCLPCNTYLHSPMRWYSNGVLPSSIADQHLSSRYLTRRTRQLNIFRGLSVPHGFGQCLVTNPNESNISRLQ